MGKTPATIDHCAAATAALFIVLRDDVRGVSVLFGAIAGPSEKKKN